MRCRSPPVTVASLEVALGGPPDGTPLIFFHGTPGAAGPFYPPVETGAERGVRHITYSRPGYGASDRHPGSPVASCAADVVAIADALGYDRFYCSGGSGGGPHSIACAALIPDRVIGVAAIATPAPIDAEDFDWTAGMGEENIEEYGAARSGERVLREYLEREAAAVDGVSPDELLQVWSTLFCDADRRAVSGAYAEHTVRQIERSLTSGIWGWFDDDLALVADWGFELDQVARSPPHLARRPGPFHPGLARRVAGRACARRQGPVAAGRRPHLDHAERLRRDPRRATRGLRRQTGSGRVRGPGRSSAMSRGCCSGGWLDPAEEFAEMLDGTMVFADVSGFTRLSERLARTGKEGAEHLVDAINACFSALLGNAYDARRRRC